MNKQEAIEIIEQSTIKIPKRVKVISKADNVLVETGFIDYVPLDVVVNTIDKIHEPQKVVVLTKRQADYIESFRLDSYFKKAKALHYINRLGWNHWLMDGYGNEIHGNELSLLKNDSDIDQLKILLTNAIINGYEVEKEQLYTVEIPNNGGTLILACINHAIKLVDGNKHFPGKFTKESIEYAGFGWVFDCDGVKVVEVE
ncbi:DUF1642 domain-containing protein [Streptococcus suis]|uniref:DUF1642 domain-containing protein n=1 Tax=Streptococcus suis TaxID=1307 RepID=UPI0038B828A1